MTVVTLKPNGVSSTYGTPTNVGGANAAASLADTSDATYVEFNDSEGYNLALEDISWPTGAAFKAIALKLRLASPTGGSVALGSELTGLANVGNVWPINWTAPTSISQPALPYAETAAAINATTLRLSGSYGYPLLRIYTAAIDVTYVIKPVVTVSAPTGTVTTTNLPTVSWTSVLDSDGGVATNYGIKVFSQAQYSAGGFNPASSTPTWSTEGTGAPASAQVAVPLADGTYRAYVRVGQTHYGNPHWSDWAYSQFVMQVQLPPVPTFSATAQNFQGRTALTVTNGAGTPSTDRLELQRSDDGGTTWVTVRTTTVGGVLSPAPTATTVYDYEAPSKSVTYRARALHNYSGVWAASAWATSTVTIDPDSWWIKHPHRPALNLPVIVRALDVVAKAGRNGIFQPLGSSAAVVISDTRGPASGTVTLRLDSLEDQAALDALLDTTDTLLLQSPAGEGGPGYVRLGNHERARIVSNLASAKRTFDTLEFVAVDKPDGTLA